VAHLFAGVVKCHCGAKMYVPTNTPKYTCAACRNKIPIVDLDNVFRDQLLRFMAAPEKVAEYLKNTNEAVAEKEALLESKKREGERVAKDCDCTYELYKQGGLTVSQFKERYAPLDTRKQQIDAELPKLQGELDVLRIDTLSEEYLTKKAENLHARWPDMDEEQRRRIVEDFVMELIVGVGEISIRFSRLPAFEQMTERQRTV
jgi:site-specific DNA recombinase